METIFRDLVPFLLDLDTFHGPYYNSFGDGCPSFGPAHPPALPQTTPPLDRFSKLRLDRNSSDSRGARAALPCNMAGSISVHCVVQCLLMPPSLFCPLLNSYFSHLFQPFSVTQGLNLVSTWVKVPHLGTFIWFQYLNFPPLRLSSKLTTFPAFIKFQYLYFPLAFLKLLAFILFQYLNFPPVPLNNFLHSCGFICGTPAASLQFLASIFLRHSKALTHLCLSATSCIHAVSRSRLLPSSLHNFLHASSFGFNIFALIWFEYLYFPPALASPQLLAFISFQYLRFLPCVPQQLPAFILLQYLNFLPGAPQELPEVI